MGVNFKALGGLLSFRYINDVEDMDLEDLQDIYNDLKEEHKNLKDELDKLKDVIDKKNPEEKREKIKKKNKIAKDILGDEEIPYEVRMKYIIDAYRKDQEKWSKLAEYAKHLESEVIRLKEILIVNGYADSGLEGDANSAKLIKEQRESINKLKAKLNELKDLKDASNKIKSLENQIETFPLRVYKARCFREIIKDQNKYIEELQELLDKNDIIYYPRTPANDLEKEGVDNVVNDALSYVSSNKEILELILQEMESA